MASVHVLAALARQLNREAGNPPIPSLYFFTDPERTPQPAEIAQRLPRGTAVVYRHFGQADRIATAARLATICRMRGLLLLVSADPELAHKYGAGVHWPVRLAPVSRQDKGLVTISAHRRRDVVRAAAFGADACVLSPFFPTRSNAGRNALGLFKASGMVRSAELPVIALGGVNADNARQLAGRGLAGIAAVDAFLDA